MDPDAPPTRPLTGVLLTNLGSPAAPEPEAVREYLREFLSDAGVVDWPRVLWWPILHGIILRRRPARTAELYRRIWTPQGSPLLVVSERQADALQQRLGSGWIVSAAMRYGRPSLSECLDRLLRAGCQRLVLLPLFPQAAAATTGSVQAELTRLLARVGERPESHVVPPFPDDPGYLDALTEGVRAELERGGPVDHHVFSFHGIPARLVRRGAPYRDHCERTARGLAARLGLAADGWSLVFQSRFGPEPWLQPYADRHVPGLARRFPRVLVSCPGFAADCLETRDEIGHVLAASFRAAGGAELRLTPCLNDRPLWIAALERLVRTTAAARAPGASRGQA